MMRCGEFCVVLALALVTLLIGVSVSSAEILGAWLFEEDGDTVKDVSGHGNDGKIFGDAEQVDGKYGKGLNFDRVDDYVDVGSDASLNPPTDITIAAWIFVESIANWNLIVTRWPGADDPSAYHFALKNGVFSMYIRGKEEGAVNNVFIDDAKAIPLGEWVHIATTAESATKKLRIFVNGSEVGSIKYDGFLQQAPSNTAIGTKLDSEGNQIGALYFSGIMDEVIILDEALTSDQLKKLMEGIELFMPVNPEGSLATNWGGIKRGYPNTQQ